MNREVKIGDLVYIGGPHTKSNTSKLKVVNIWYIDGKKIITVLRGNYRHDYYAEHIKLCNKVKVWIE